MFERAGTYDEEYKAYKDLELKIRPFTVEYSAYFDGKTTVNVSENKLLSLINSNKSLEQRFSLA